MQDHSLIKKYYMKRSLLLIFAVLFIAAKILYSQISYPDMDKMRVVIQTQNLKFAEGVTKKDASAFMDLYSDNAKMLAPGEDFIIRK